MQERLIVALDFSTQQEAEAMVKLLGEEVTFYKVGLELFLNTGGSILNFLAEHKKRIFLDLKFHDIPNTTAAAARFVAGLSSVSMFNIHASGGFQMIQDSVATARNDQIVLAVTALTSLDSNDIKNSFQSSLDVSEFAFNLAVQAYRAGAQGVVCSALEAGTIKSRCGDQFVTVCPGIRFRSDQKGDQKRTLDPCEAIRNGADYLVVGRPITADPSPKDAALRMLDEIVRA
ncbi:MAG: orotidine-5'-phosphate decarboxylase [Brevinema sp.]